VPYALTFLTFALSSIIYKVRKNIMKKICCSLLAVFSVSFLTSFHLPPAEPGPKKPVISTIIIDAGHGGSDRGAKGAYSYEKDICLAIALKLGKKLEAGLPNVKVLYTRTKDVY